LTPMFWLWAILPMVEIIPKSCRQRFCLCFNALQFIRCFTGYRIESHLFLFPLSFYLAFLTCVVCSLDLSFFNDVYLFDNYILHSLIARLLCFQTFNSIYHILSFYDFAKYSVTAVQPRGFF